MSNYDKTLISIFIVYLDANLYGYAISETMPSDGFHWVSSDQFFKETDKVVPDDTGYFVEVDLDYPLKLHDAHNDYPFCTESVLIDYNLLSQQQRNYSSSANTSGKSVVQKLVPNLLDKRRYILHYKI